MVNGERLMLNYKIQSALFFKVKLKTAILQIYFIEKEKF